VLAKVSAILLFFNKWQFQDLTRTAHGRNWQLSNPNLGQFKNMLSHRKIEIKTKKNILFSIVAYILNFLLL
jgi:hypothetical protein